jgi:hypothetical protein
MTSGLGPFLYPWNFSIDIFDIHRALFLWLFISATVDLSHDEVWYSCLQANGCVTQAMACILQAEISQIS